MRHLPYTPYPVCLIALLVLPVLGSCKMTTLPAGPLAADIEEGTRRTSSGDVVAYSLFVPQALEGVAAPPWPAVVLNHGFARSKAYQRNHALYMAQRGILVMTPDMVSLLGGESAQLRNIANTLDHVQWLRQRAADPDDSLFGLVDPDRMAMAGHSAGGAVSFEAAIDSQTSAGPVAAVVLLDAVPWDRTIERASQMQPLALASLRSEPSACNRNGRVLDVLQGLSFPVPDVRIIGATHCDPENPSDCLCGITCGPASPSSKALYQELMYLFLRDAFGLPPLEGEPASYAARLDELDAQGQVAVNP
jgi:pimeloyl-ACP methyl ester carboxylesterase